MHCKIKDKSFDNQSFHLFYLQLMFVLLNFIGATFQFRHLDGKFFKMSHILSKKIFIWAYISRIQRITYKKQANLL